MATQPPVKTAPPGTPAVKNQLPPGMVFNQLTPEMQDLRKRMAERVAADADTIDQLSTARLPEDAFVNFFLKYFTGERDTSDGQDAIVKWISVAGSPTAEVVIFDATGKELFKVPPLIDTSIVKSERKLNQRVGFAAIVALAQQYGSHLRVQGERFLTENLAKKRAEIRTESQVHTAHEQRWLEIFNRYQKGPKVDIKAVAKNAGTATDDDLQFE